MRIFTWIQTRFHPLWRLRRQAWFRAFQRRFDFPVSVRTGRIRKYVLFLRDFSHVAPHAGAERRTEECLESLLKSYRPDIFLDIGANVGSYSWIVVNHDPAVKVWLFEPDETNVGLIRKTIAANHLESTRLFPVALSSEKGGAGIYGR